MSNQRSQLLYSEVIQQCNSTSASTLLQQDFQPTNPGNLNVSPFETVPSRKNAVVLENSQEFSQDQLLRATADLLGGQNIQYCAKLSGGRFCIYLSNESATTTICNQGLVVNNTVLPCRRYASQATKFLISNCPPEMSDEALLKLLQRYGKPVSTPTKISVNTIHQDLRHVKTWKRSLYLQVSKDAPPCPEVMHITSSEGEKHTLYITEQKPSRPKSTDEEFPEYVPSPSLRLTTSQARNPPTSSDEQSHSRIPPDPNRLKKSDPEETQDQCNLTSKPTRPRPPAAAAPSAAAAAATATTDTSPAVQPNLTSPAVRHPFVHPPPSITVPAPSPNLSTDPAPPNSNSSLPKKRTLCLQSPQTSVSSKVQKTISKPKSIPPENPNCDKEQEEYLLFYLDLEKVISEISFNEAKLTKEQFQTVMLSTSFIELNTAIQENLDKFDRFELYTVLCKANKIANNHYVKSITKNAKKILENIPIVIG